MKAIFAIVIIATATSLSAETLSFPSFEIDMADGWEHSVETGPGDDRGGVITFYHPGGVGSLKILSYDAPGIVSEGRLRNMTNVDASMPLTWQHWGDYSGYQYDYRERGALFRQWWLVNVQTLVFITYQGDPESQDTDMEDVDGMVRSLTVRKPRT